MTTSLELTADIEARDGTKIGEGPLINVLSLRYGRFLGESGYFQCELPLLDERTDLVEEKSTILRFYRGSVEEFVGVVESTGAAVDNDGTLTLPVSGRCLGGAELSEAKIGFLELASAGSGVTNGPAQVLTAADTYTTATWALDTTDGYSTTSTAVYAKFAGESALQALRKIAEKIGEHWRFHETDRKVVWMRTDTPSSGIRAIQGASEMVAAESNPLICFFQSFEESNDVHDLFNQIFPYGAGAFEIATTLNSATRTAPSGFTLSTAGNYLRNDTSIADLGLTIPVYVQFPDIRPVSNTDADVTAAGNALYDAALAMLQRHDTVDDFKIYSLGGIVQMPSDVKVGTKLLLEYESDRYNVDAEFIVLGIETELSPGAEKRHSLTVAAVDKMPESGTSAIVNTMEDGRVFQNHPIRNVNSYETGYTKFVYHDGTNEETAKIYFDFDDEVTEIQQVVLKFETAGGSPVAMLPLESTVRSVGGSSTSTGASSAATTSSGGSATPTSGASSTSSSGSSSEPGVTGSNLAAGDPHSHNFTTPLHSHDIAHTHDVSIAAHAHDMPHTHDVTASISATYGLYRETTANTFNLADLRYRVNSGSWANLIDDATALSGNLYSLDITAQVYDSDFRPVQAANILEIACTSGGTGTDRKSCTIDGRLKIRNIIQSTATF